MGRKPPENVIAAFIWDIVFGKQNIRVFCYWFTSVSESFLVISFSVSALSLSCSSALVLAG